MEQGQYLINIERGKVRQAGGLSALGGASKGGARVTYRRKTRDTGKTIGGLFTKVEDAGWDRSWLVVHAGYVARTVPASAEGVKSIIRRLRDQEAAKLEAIDQRIAELEEALSKARAGREEALREAWRKGNVVTLAEVKAVADEAAKGDL